MRHTFASESRKIQDKGQSHLNQFEDTLAALYARVSELADCDNVTGTSNQPYEALIREFVHPQFNLDDPTERAEHMMVALGGRPQVMPATLLRP